MAKKKKIKKNRQLCSIEGECVTMISTAVTLNRTISNGQTRGCYAPGKWGE